MKNSKKLFMCILALALLATLMFCTCQNNARGEAATDIILGGHEMFIVNKERDSMINTAMVTALYIGADRSIKAVCGNNDKMYRLGAYSTDLETKVAFESLITGMSSKQDVYIMPDDRRTQELCRNQYSDSYDKFAGNGKKPTRRGGS
jgi:hypothetical protein